MYPLLIKKKIIKKLKQKYKRLRSAKRAVRAVIVI